MTHREEAFVQPVPRCSLPLGAHVTQHNLGSQFSGGLQSLNPSPNTLGRTGGLEQ